MRPRPALAALLALACRAPEAPPFLVEAVAVDDDGRPVPGVAVLAGADPLAVTDAAGVARGVLRGHDGDRVAIAFRAPEGLRVVGPAERGALLQVVAPLAGGAPRPQPVRLTATLAPLERRYVILVRTDGRVGVPVRARGRIVGETDASGLAQILLRAPPGEELAVTLDTTAQPALRPANPTRVLGLPDRDDVLVVRQDFAEARARGARRPPRAPRRLW